MTHRSFWKLFNLPGDIGRIGMGSDFWAFCPCCALRFATRVAKDGARCYAFVSDNGSSDPTQCPGPWMCCGAEPRPWDLGMSNVEGFLSHGGTPQWNIRFKWMTLYFETWTSSKMPRCSLAFETRFPVLSCEVKMELGSKMRTSSASLRRRLGFSASYDHSCWFVAIAGLQRPVHIAQKSGAAMGVRVYYIHMYDTIEICISIYITI